MATEVSEKITFDPENKSFEETLNYLEELSKKIKENDMTLDETISCYEEGQICYQHLKKILEETKQKIEIFESVHNNE